MQSLRYGIGDYECHTHSTIFAFQCLLITMDVVRCHFFAWCTMLWLVLGFPKNMSCSPKLNFACYSSKMVCFPQQVHCSTVRKNRCLTLHDRKIVLLLISLIMIAPEVLTRRWWVHPMNRVWVEKGEFIDVVLRLHDFPECFHKCFCMTVDQFDELLNLLEHHIKKQQTNYRKPISPAQQLAVCLRYVWHLCRNMNKFWMHNVRQRKIDKFTLLAMLCLMLASLCLVLKFLPTVCARILCIPLHVLVWSMTSL